MRGIFYNSPKSQCSIYESGLMIYNALKLSSMYTIDYTESKEMHYDYDFLIFNYHPYVNGWIENYIESYKGKTFGIVLEVGHYGNKMPNTAKIFNKYLIIDPTIEDNGRIFGFGRPLEKYTASKYKEQDFPTVGTFGFATPGKMWTEVVDLTQKDFDKALIRFNIPCATFVSNSQAEIDKIINDLYSIALKPEIKLEITHEYMEKTDLIDWCAQNTINVFPYYRDLAGLAAVTDQAVSALRPILTTNNSAFRHINKYITPLPNISLKDAITKNYEGVLKMANDWSQENFYKKFEEILKNV